jgi:hypothetical protein
MTKIKVDNPVVPKTNKTLIEKAKTAILFGALVFAIGFCIGNHEANKNQNVVRNAITSAVHQSLVKE